MHDKTKSNTPKQGNGRVVILAVFAAFLAPVLIALLMQSSFWSYQPESSKAHGQLIKPVIALSELQQAIPARDKWWLLTIDDGNCAEICEKTLIEMRQLRKAAGRHTQEIGLLYLSSNPIDPAVKQRIQTIEPKFQQLSSTAMHKTISNTASSLATGEIWLLDRDLNLFMFYPEDHNATGIRKDLKRILTWAQEKPE